MKTMVDHLITEVVLSDLYAWNVRLELGILGTLGMDMILHIPLPMVPVKSGIRAVLLTLISLTRWFQFPPRLAILTLLVEIKLVSQRGLILAI